MSLIPLNWQQTARWRRWVMFSLIAVINFIACYWLEKNLSPELPLLLQLFILMPFSILLFWLELGFFTALLGFWMLSKQKKQQKRDNHSNDKWLPYRFPTKASTAVLLPIYNEDVAYVYAGLKSIYQSLQQAGYHQHFEFYILSDSDNANHLLQEGAAWTTLCEELDAKGRIHYRHRKHRVKKKSGNIMDFCRRWGNRHPYMVVLDADSLIGGKTLAQLVTIMEKNPQVGLLQAPLYSTGINSFFARSQQFVNRLYGPVFFAGLNYWWQGESQYWGHNVIIRTQAFMQHCDLPKLDEAGSLGGEILSHDFVEAALLNRAGWETWLAYELDDSFERPPPTLTDALKRDRRWCQGNLQHWHIIWSRDIPQLQRFLLLGGIMSYVSSLIWLLWLLALSFAAIAYNNMPLIPSNQETFAILGITLVLLFVYKMFGLVHIMQQKSIKGFGGILNLLRGVLAETLLSILVAPIRMMYYSRFVLEVLTGQKIGWNTQQRTGHELSWRTSFREYRWIMLIGFAWVIALAFFNQTALVWMLPVLGGLISAAAVAVLTSRTKQQSRLFITPDDKQPSYILEKFEENHKDLQRYTCLSSRDLFTHVLVDPLAHQKYMAYTPYRHRTPEKTQEQREQLAERLLKQGPASLNNHEYLVLLADPVLMCRLHSRIWKLPESQFQQHWLNRI